MTEGTRTNPPLLDAHAFEDETFIALWRSRFDAEVTRGQVEAVVARLEEHGISEGARILDACGGDGRIGRPLARGGFEVTVLDASQHMLDRGAAMAGHEKVDWRRADIRTARLADDAPPYDAALLMGQSFGYFQTDAEHARAMRSLGAMLRPGGILLMDVVHRDFAATVHAPRTWYPLDDGRAVLHAWRFDPIAGRSHESVRIEGDPPDATRRFSLRIFNLTELERLLQAGELEIVDVLGDYDGTAFHVDEPRLVLVGRHRG